MTNPINPEIDPSLSYTALPEMAPPSESAGSVSKYALRVCAGAAIALTFMASGPGEADARESRYKPNAGDWIASEPSSYYIGRAFEDEGDKLKKLGTSPSRTYDFGTVPDKRADKCGWLEDDVIKTVLPSYINKTCTASRKDLRNRYYYGEDFNCPPNKCVSGTSDGPITEECDNNFYYNFATTRRSPLNNNPKNGFSGFHDYAGKETGPVSYRYTTKYGSKDKNRVAGNEAGQAVVVRSTKYGWGFMRYNCVAEEDRRGGIMRTYDSVAGANPNGGDQDRRVYYTPGA